MIERGLAERTALGEAEGKNQLFLDDLMKKANEEKLSYSSLSVLKSKLKKI